MFNNRKLYLQVDSEMKDEAVEDGEIETEVVGDSITISIKLLPLIKSLQAQHGLRWGHDIRVPPTPLFPWSSVVLWALYEASQGHFKGAVSAHKALEGSKSEMRELLGGTEENSVFLKRGH